MKYLVFDIAEECIRKPYAQEDRLRSTSEQMMSHEEDRSTSSLGQIMGRDEADFGQSSGSDTLMSADEKQEFSTRKKKPFRRLICPERRGVQKDLMNLKGESGEAKCKGPKLDKPWTYRDESGKFKENN